jgi:hypothetical protein
LKAEEINGELSISSSTQQALELTYELKDGDEDEKDEDNEGDPVKVPNLRLSTRFSFFAVWALFLVFWPRTGRPRAWLLSALFEPFELISSKHGRAGGCGSRLW